MPERDTSTILAALTTSINSLEDSNHWVSRPERERAAVTLRTLRSQIEKERPFVEAAMEFCALHVRIDPANSGRGYSKNWDAFIKAYRALSEKPPEEGEKS